MSCDVDKRTGALIFVRCSFPLNLQRFSGTSRSQSPQPSHGTPDASSWCHTFVLRKCSIDLNQKNQKKKRFDLGRNWNLWSNLQPGYLQKPLVCLANPEKKVTTHQFVPRHFRIRAMPPGRPETRELRRPCRFCDGKTGFSTMKEHKWTTNHPTSSRCLQTLLLVPKICNRPKIGFDFTLTSLGPWKATHRGAEGISLWLSAMTTTWAAASASHTWQESIGRARQWREKYLENVPIQWNSMQCNDMQSMQRNAKECKGVQWCAVKWSEMQ